MLQTRSGICFPQIYGFLTGLVKSQKQQRESLCPSCRTQPDPASQVPFEVCSFFNFYINIYNFELKCYFRSQQIWAPGSSTTGTILCWMPPHYQNWLCIPGTGTGIPRLLRLGSGWRRNHGFGVGSRPIGRVNEDSFRWIDWWNKTRKYVETSHPTFAL